MAVKNVCFQCVNDPFLGRQIKRKGTSAACSLCNTRRKCFPLSEIVARVDAILNQYICEGETDFRWSCDASEQYQKGDPIDVWVGVVFGCDNVEPIVVAVCQELTSYSDDVNYSRHSLGLDDDAYRWGEFQEGMKHESRFFNEGARAYLDWIFQGLEKYSASSSEHAVVRILSPETAPPIYRARTCMTSESVQQIMANPARNLAAPPKALSGEGRMNPAGIPAFYGAFERMTCIAELRPPVGCSVVSGQFRLNKEVRVLDFGRFESADLGPTPSFFDPKCFGKIGRRNLLRRLHDEITQPVLPGMERNYLTSQVIAEYLATHCKPKLDGVIFKSVQESSGTNIVLFSHVACPAQSSSWQFDGGMYVCGAKSSDAPRIQYEPGSLVYHAIKGVQYVPEDSSLPEGKT